MLANRYTNWIACLRWLAGLLFFLLPLAGCPFSVLTYNIAELSDPSPERVQKLLTSIASLKPDAVLLQEASRSTRELAAALPALKDYHYIDYPLTNGQPSGGLSLLLKSTLKPSQIRYAPLDSEMDRGLLSITLIISDIPHRLVNLHLESPDLLFWRGNYFRKQQVLELNKLSADFPAIIIGGDFNLWAGSEAEQALAPNWQDVWTLLYPQNPGLTWEPKTNSMAWKDGGFVLSGGRFDRILFKSPVLIVQRVERIGLNVSPPLSDHYGLMGTFKVVQPNQSADETGH